MISYRFPQALLLKLNTLLININRECEVSGYLRIYLFYFLITFLIWVLALLFVFQPYFYGDEVYSIHVSNQKSILLGYLELCRYKPRLLGNAFILLGFRFFADHRIILALLSIFLQSASSAFLFLVLQKFLRCSFIPSLVLGFGLSFIRFPIYCVYEFNLGLIEGSAQLFFTLYLFFIFSFWYVRSLNNFFLCLVMALCATLCHERYVACFLPVLAICIFQFRSENKFIIFIRCISISITLLFVLCLPYLLHTHHALSGTAGQPLQLLTKNTMYQIGDSVKNIFGLNVGPPYLVGTATSVSSIKFLYTLPEIIVLVALFIHFMYSCAISLRNTDRCRSDFYLSLFLIILLGFPFIIVSSMSIRLELRWLFAPFITLVFAYLFAISNSRVKNYYALALGLTSLIAFLSQISAFRNIYFVQASKDCGAVGSLISSGVFDGQTIVAYFGPEQFWNDFFSRFPKIKIRSSQTVNSDNFIYLGIVDGKISILSKSGINIRN
jgi:hypothetical protein